MKALPSRQCKNCNGYFFPKRKNQIFCTDECRFIHYDAHYYHKITTSKTCPNCGESFTTASPFKQTYCSDKCRLEARSKRYHGEEFPYMNEAIQEMKRIFEGHPNPRGREKPIQLEEKLRQRGYKQTPTISIT